jgi:hypothetical protein
MPLTVDRYTLLLAPSPDADPVEHEVALVNGDRLRAELEGPKHGIHNPATSPMHYMTLCLWAACLRSKVLEDVDFPTFKDQCLEFAEVEQVEAFPGDDPAPDPMGPTQAGDIASPSSSPASSDPSSFGSTPPPTPA